MASYRWSVEEGRDASVKCPNCGEEVERGSLYCPKCLAEVPWVREFDTMETRMHRQKLETKAAQSGKNLRIRWKGCRARLKKLLHMHKREVSVLFLALVLLMGGAAGALSRQTFSSLYARARNAWQKENYEQALELVDRALEKHPSDDKANLLLAMILEKRGEIPASILVLKASAKKNPDSVQTYDMLMRLLSNEGKTAEIEEILSECTSKEVLEACREYICPEPQASLAAGTYTSVQNLELSAGYDRIYYTLDGSMPSQDSARYTGPITLGEGTTVLNAFGVNDRNISSGILTLKYVVVLKGPSAPEVAPESGIYRRHTVISIEVPDGCRAYYAFDKEPDEDSTEYINPITMPQGMHVFYAILIAANGKVSETTMRDYYLEY